MLLIAVVATLAAVTTGIVFAAALLDRSARLRRRARRSPICAVREAQRDQVIRVRGTVRGSGSFALPFSGRSGVHHWTQLTDTANPGQTSSFTRSARCEFRIDDGTGEARVPLDAELLVVGGEPEGGGVDRNDPEVPRFLGKDEARLFSKGGWLIWRQQAFAVGDQLVIWGRVILEPDPDPRHEALRDRPQRVALAPAEPGLPLVVERLR